jgi:hypothetical protein
LNGTVIGLSERLTSNQINFMKTILLLLATAFSLSAHAQSRYFKSDGGFGAALTMGEVKSYGISASVEPKFFITPKISAGMRFEGDALFGGKIDDASSASFSVNTSSRTAILVKGEYYFSENKNRPFVGVMAGRYAQANIGAGSSGSASITAGSYFGGAPEVGYTFNNFRISGIYHIVPGADLVSASSGAPIEVSRNFLVIQLGFRVYQSKSF